jgi:NarL family two-component system response regulator LiaR
MSESGAAIRVLIVDDHAVVREGLRTYLSLEEGIELAGEAGNGREAVTLACTLKPDVVLMDLQMPELDGVAATAAISERLPDTRVIVLTSFTDDEHVLPAIKAGATGYLLKDASAEELVQAIEAASRGEARLHPMIAKRLMQQVTTPREQRAEVALTPRELEVLRLVARGMSNKEIARALVTSERTVKGHVSNVLGKLELSDRTQAALYAVRHGIVPLSE